MQKIITLLIVALLLSSCGGQFPGFDHQPFHLKNCEDFEKEAPKLLLELGIKHLDPEEIPFEEYNIQVPEHMEDMVHKIPIEESICGYQERPGSYRRKWFVASSQWVEKNYYIIWKSPSDECSFELLKITVEAPNERYSKWRQANSADDEDISLIIQKFEEYDKIKN